MAKQFSRIGRKKQAGFVINIELVLLFTILVVGILLGLVELRNSVVAELHDTAEAIGALDQTYTFAGTSNADGSATTQGSTFDDAEDDSSGFGDTGSGDAGADISVVTPVANDEAAGP